MTDNKSEILLRKIFTRICEGDKDAFAQLFFTYYDRIYSSILKYSKISATAEDIVQDIFVKVWEKRSLLSKIENPEAWLFTIVRNHTVDKLRTLLLSEKYKEYAHQLIKKEENSPEHLVIMKQRRDLIERGLSHLSEKQKEIYYLSRENGLTYEEIATKLKISRETVKEHMSKAISKMKAYLITQKKEFFYFLLWFCQNYFF